MGRGVGPEAPRPKEWFDRFDSRTRSVVAFAVHAARALRHNYVGTEHLLVGLSTAAETNRPLARYLSPAGTRLAIEELVGRGSASVAKPSLTPRARRALERGHELSFQPDAGSVTPDHLLLAILETDDDAIAQRVLMRAGVDRDSLRAQVEASMTG